MLEIFSSQTDYQAFLVGLGFLFLFLICTSLAQVRHSSPIFFWLALFGLSQWGCQWLAMLTPAWGNPVLQDFITTILILVALSFLGAGGLSIVLPSVGRRLAISILTLILSVPWLFSLLGLSNFFGAVVIIVGVGCSLLAGWALLIVARGKHAILLSFGALALMGYGLTLPLILPADQFALIQAIHELGRPVLDLIPLSAFQVVFSFLTTISMWFFYQNEVWCRPARENLAGVEPLMYSSYFILATCFILVIGGVSTGMFGRNLEADMRVELASRARIMAAALPPESIKQLTGSEADVGKPIMKN